MGVLLVVGKIAGQIEQIRFGGGYQSEIEAASA